MIPSAMMSKYPQFILYNDQKLPINPHTLEVADAHDPAAWCSANEILVLSELTGYGVGFVFTDSDPFFFFDIDSCRVGDQWSELSLQIWERFKGCYVEISKSGNGFHIFGIAGSQDHGCKNVPLGMELYTSGRYVALTGTAATGDAGHDPGDNYSWLVDTYFPVGSAGPENKIDWSDKPVAEYTGPVDDAILIEKMLRSKNAQSIFGGKASIEALWTADVSVLSTCYPPVGSGEFDHSSADAALCSHLAFWTGKDCARMERLFNQSALVRDKWTNREKYRITTISNAVNNCQNVLGFGRSEVIAPGLPEGSATVNAELREGFQYLTVQDQIKLFTGCVYVRDCHKVLVPDGGMLKPDQFKAFYGGYVMAIDNDGAKTTKNAWQAFTESQGANFPKVATCCFRPELPSGDIVKDEGWLMVNTYVPITTRSIPGDASRFTDHVARLLPDLRDQQILLSYMAAIIQYPGVKFQWCPLLQGVEGNGKTLFARCISHAIGHRYTHLPNPKDLGNKFNSWILNKLFIGIEEIAVGDKQEIIDSLKQLITNERIEVQGKGDNQATGDNRANFMMFTNPKDGLRKTSNDRRYCVFYSAQQTSDDNIKDGLTDEYFHELYEWLKIDGYAIVNNFLQNYQIVEEFNPATKCQRAPKTSSTDEAIVLSRGGVEQEIMAAIEEGRPGFIGGWVSSMALDRLLVRKRADRRIPRNKRTEIMRDLGYYPHPTLKGGRVDNVIALDGGKPRLYIKKGHIAQNITKKSEVARVYSDAQAGGVEHQNMEANRIFKET